MKTILTWVKNNHKILLVLLILSCFLYAFSRMAQTKIVVVKADQEKEVVIIGNPKNIKITNKQ